MATELYTAIKKGDAAAVDALLERDRTLVDSRDASGLSPVLTALYHGRTDIADAILRRRPTLDVFEAAAAGDAARVRELVERDATLANATSPDGYTALGLAAFFKRRDVVRFLVENGADVRPASRQGKFTPLHSAVATDAGPVDVDIVRLLLGAGADPNAKSASGGTPLHTAAFVGDRAVAELLLARGADRGIRNGEGKTAADIARARGHDAVAEMLGPRSR